MYLINVMQYTFSSTQGRRRCCRNGGTPKCRTISDSARKDFKHECFDSPEEIPEHWKQNRVME